MVNISVTRIMEVVMLGCLWTRTGQYFEVEILSLGQRGTIAIGVVPRDYPENHQPGWGEYSIGYHADDGLLYNETGTGKKFGPKCNVGDRIGCGITWISMSDWLGYDVVFTRNGRKIGERSLPRINAHLVSILYYYPAIGMHSPGEKVKVILDAKLQV
ncbi:SPRY domain-containing protein 3-like isoform X2 [Mercenaria mercenaria]|uniref:SPRY domain-containing protein 3-like isoform X2 n=1 Tax=Mercenaria mercenaria TaxID=6596 RepID=UPI00234F78E0|nr:SPRY domain-containing protein 3-like isoform X2 [Mercenaria mercenaria]